VIDWLTVHVCACVRVCVCVCVRVCVCVCVCVCACVCVCRQLTTWRWQWVKLTLSAISQCSKWLDSSRKLINSTATDMLYVLSAVVLCPVRCSCVSVHPRTTDLLFGKFQISISPHRLSDIWFLGLGSWSLQIKWRYFHFDQIQDGCQWPSWKVLIGHICAMGHPIHCMFGSRVGSSGSAD